MTIDNQFSSDKRQAPTKTKRFGDDPYTQELKVLKADLAFLKEAWADAERRSQELDAILRFRLGELRTWKGLLRFMRRSVGLGQSDINTEMRKQGRAAIQQIIPHANERGSALENQAPANDLCIAVFCFDRPTYLGHVHKSLGKQSALHLVHVIIDGHQGNPAKREETERVVKVAKQHGVGQIHRHYGNLGFRKLMISALVYLSARYRQLIIIEDDCFPTASAIETFKEELREIENDPSIFSVYGHPFGVPNERTGIGRDKGLG